MKAYVYILKCEGNDTHFTGVTYDLERTVRDHELGKAGRYTKRTAPVSLRYSRECKNMKEAKIYQKIIRRWPHYVKRAFLENDIDTLMKFKGWK